jgi:hypothetical protein
MADLSELEELALDPMASTGTVGGWDVQVDRGLSHGRIKGRIRPLIVASWEINGRFSPIFGRGRRLHLVDLVEDNSLPVVAPTAPRRVGGARWAMLS